MLVMIGSPGPTTILYARVTLLHGKRHICVCMFVFSSNHAKLFKKTLLYNYSVYIYIYIIGFLISDN